MKRLFTAFLAFALIFAFASCNGDKNAQTAANAGKDSVTPVDMTKDFEQLDVSKFDESNRITAEPQLSFSSRCRSFEEIYDNSRYIVEATVSKSYFTVLEGNPYNAADIVVKDSIKGDLSENTEITVLFYGGYMTVQQEVEHYNDAEKFSGIDKDKWSSTYIEEELTEGDFAVKGDEYVLCLNDSDLEKGAYSAVNEFETTFKKSKGGVYERTLPSGDYYGDTLSPDARCLDGDYTKTVDGETMLKDDVSFSIEDFKNACASYKT